MSPRGNAWLANQPAEPALSGMIALSAIVHLVAAVIVIALPKGMLVRTPPPVTVYTVKIVDPDALGGRLTKGEIHPEAPPVGVTQPAPKEEAKPPPPEPKVEEKKPEPKPELKVEEKKPVEAKPKPEATPKRSKEEQTRSARDREIQEAIKRVGEKGKGKQASGLGGVEEGKGAALGTGGDGAGGGILTGLDFIIYKNRVEAIIKKNWTWVGANPDLTIRVGFRIGDDGQIADLHVVGRSGDSSFDESVLRAIRISSPLPPPPEKYRQTFASYVLEFVSGQLAGG